jgi:hypothetical protein
MTMSRSLATAALLAAASACFGEPAAPSTPPVPPADRLVGVAYTTWFTDTRWNNVWGTPELGFYKSDDRAVIRQHGTWLAEAGVDFIFVDWSNNVDYTPGQPKNAHIKPLEDATTAVFEEFTGLKKRPRIAIMLGTAGAPPAATDGRLQRKADQVWSTYGADPRFRPLLQEYLGKPLLIVYTNTPTPYGEKPPAWSDPRFTVRWMTGYVMQQGQLVGPGNISRSGYWSWEDRGEQPYPIVNGHPEAMTVVASWRQQSEPGKDGYIPAAGRRDGATLREQWARARSIGPKFALVVSWNEWVRGEQPSAEISKDLEPSKEHGRFYLDLLKEQIALFKTGK